MPDKIKRQRDNLNLLDEDTKKEMLELEEFAEEKQKLKKKIERKQ